MSLSLEQLFKDNLTIFQSCGALSFVIIIKFKIKYNIQRKNWMTFWGLEWYFVFFSHIQRVLEEKGRWWPITFFAYLI